VRYGVPYLDSLIFKAFYILVLRCVSSSNEINISCRGGVLEDDLGLEDSFWSPWPPGESFESSRSSKFSLFSVEDSSFYLAFNRDVEAVEYLCFRFRLLLKCHAWVRFRFQLILPKRFSFLQNFTASSFRFLRFLSNWKTEKLKTENLVCRKSDKYTV